MRCLSKRIWAAFVVLVLCASGVCFVSIQEEKVQGKAESTIFPMRFSEVDITDEISCEVNNIENLHGQSVPEYQKGYLHSDVNLIMTPEAENEMVQVFRLNEEVTYTDLGNGWSLVVEQDKTLYVESDMLYETPLSSIEYNIENSNGFKSFMPYKTEDGSIFVKSSEQYKLQQLSTTGVYGIRMCENRFCVAIGTHFLSENVYVGTYFDVVLENGTVIPCIIGDVKDEKDTKEDNITTACNGCVSEFIVDMGEISREVKWMGDVSYACEEWQSAVEQIIIYDKNVEF